MINTSNNSNSSNNGNNNNSNNNNVTDNNNNNNKNSKKIIRIVIIQVSRRKFPLRLSGALKTKLKTSGHMPRLRVRVRSPEPKMCSLSLPFCDSRRHCITEGFLARLESRNLNIGALIIGMGFWGILYYNHN